MAKANIPGVLTCDRWVVVTKQGVVIEIIGRKPENKPYMHIEDRNGKMVAIVEGKHLKFLGQSIAQAFRIEP